MTTIIAFKGTKLGFDWVVISGSTQSDATIAKRSKSTAPLGRREEQLAWVTKEVQELLHTHKPNSAAIQQVGGGNFSDALVERIEVNGVIRATLGGSQIPTQSIKNISLAKSFGVKRFEFDDLLDTLPSIQGLPKTHRELVALGLSQLPSSL